MANWPFNERAFAFDALLSSRFDIFQFPFQFNPGKNGRNVEMGLIYKSYLMTLNQRLQGSSPCAPTNQINNLVVSTASRVRQ
jgi:hypothetical protein